MISQIVDFLFGCTHSNYSFPQTVRAGRRSDAAAVTGTYVVCLGCGKELPYDWRSMKVVAMPAPEQHAAVAEALESFAGKAS